MVRRIRHLDFPFFFSADMCRSMGVRNEGQQDAEALVRFSGKGGDDVATVLLNGAMEANDDVFVALLSCMA
jgi:hypothetical protein